MAKKSGTNASALLSHTDAILESISDGVFTVDDQWRVTSFNRAAEQITGIDRSDALGKPCSEVFRSSLCEGACALGKTLSSGESIVNKSCYIINVQGDRIPISVSTAVLRDAQGRVIGGAETFRDLSDVMALRKALQSQCHLYAREKKTSLCLWIISLTDSIAFSSGTLQGSRPMC